MTDYIGNYKNRPRTKNSDCGKKSRERTLIV